MSNKKYLFIDLDGTIIDHETHTVPESTLEAFKLARENGHELILTTGRPPCLFNGIDKELEMHNYIGANGRVAIYHDEVIYSETINQKDIELLIDHCRQEKIDIGFQGLDYFALQSKYDDLYVKFSNAFNIQIPDYMPDFYKENDVYQIAVYSSEHPSKFERIVPDLYFSTSNEYGLDVNTRGGLKEKGIQVYMKHLGLTQDDIIAIGDGFNDIGMLQFAETSVAMGNAHPSVQAKAKYVTDTVSNSGLAKAFKMLGVI